VVVLNTVLSAAALARDFDIGISIGDTFLADIGIGIGNTFQNNR
jgi:hypothetical protein